MGVKENVIDFQEKSRQADKQPRHKINRGDGSMIKTDKSPKETSAIINITLINYDSSKQEEYSKKFMSPLVNGLLQRMQMAKAE